MINNLQQFSSKRLYINCLLNCFLLESHSLKGQRVDSDDLMFPIDEVSASNVVEMKGSGKFR